MDELLNPIGLEPVKDAVLIRQGAYLPHWTRAGSVYSVTFRLGDSLPLHVLEAWRSARELCMASSILEDRHLTVMEERHLNELYSSKLEEYLDAGHGACWLKNPEIAGLTAAALRHFDGER